MTTYRITSSTFSALVSTDQGYVVSASPPFANFIDLDFRLIRDLADKNGWMIVPVIEREHPSVLETDGRTFELRWRGDVLVRVSEHMPCEVKDIKFEQLPEILKRLI